MVLGEHRSRQGEGDRVARSHELTAIRLAVIIPSSSSNIMHVRLVLDSIPPMLSWSYLNLVNTVPVLSTTYTLCPLATSIGLGRRWVNRVKGFSG